VLGVDAGWGAPAPPRLHPASARTVAAAGFTWSDLAGYVWARPAINWVGKTNDWMRDFAPNADGTVPFQPALLEPRQYFARAIVSAFAPLEEPDPAIVFDDLDPTSAFYRYANVAVKMGWIRRVGGTSFRPSEPVTTKLVHRALVRALGLGPTAAEIDRLHTANGVVFDTPDGFGTLLLGLRLGLRYNNKVDESRDVGPATRLDRGQVAWSLYVATTLDPSVVPWLADQYAGIELPRMGPARQAIVRWGIRFVGFPYVWGGEWGFARSEPPALGGQPIPGFDCSGLTWWVTRRDDGGAWEVAPPRPYEGWSLPQRTSRDMAKMAPRHLRYNEIQAGDLMFYDGDDDGTVDHVDVAIGNGWALDSGSSVGGVTIMWVGPDSWYQDHFKWGRRILPR
jgi:cell wall-associated NlpC family hydrolase